MGQNDFSKLFFSTKSCAAHDIFTFMIYNISIDDILNHHREGCHRSKTPIF